MDNNDGGDVFRDARNRQGAGDPPPPQNELQPLPAEEREQEGPNDPLPDNPEEIARSEIRLFREVLPKMLPYMDSNSVIRCRAVCRVWKEEVTNLVETYFHWRNYTEGKQKGPLAPWSSSLRGYRPTVILGSPADVQRFDEQLTSGPEGGLPDKPFLGKAVYLRYKVRPAPADKVYSSGEESSSDDEPPTDDEITMDDFSPLYLEPSMGAQPPTDDGAAMEVEPIPKGEVPPKGAAPPNGEPPPNAVAPPNSAPSPQEWIAAIDNLLKKCGAELHHLKLHVHFTPRELYQLLHDNLRHTPNLRVLQIGGKFLESSNRSDCDHLCQLTLLLPLPRLQLQSLFLSGRNLPCFLVQHILCVLAASAKRLLLSHCSFDETLIVPHQFPCLEELTLLHVTPAKAAELLNTTFANVPKIKKIRLVFEGLVGFHFNDYVVDLSYRFLEYPHLTSFKIKLDGVLHTVLDSVVKVDEVQVQ